MTTQMETRRTGAGLENVKEYPAILPNVDVYENASEILLVVDLPGVARDGLSIDLDKDHITLEARRIGPQEHTPQVTEFRALAFRRSFSMPPGIDRDKVDAELRAGVLRLRLPKSEAARPRQIKVRTS